MVVDTFVDLERVDLEHTDTVDLVEVANRAVLVEEEDTAALVEMADTAEMVVEDMVYTEEVVD